MYGGYCSPLWCSQHQWSSPFNYTVGGRVLSAAQEKKKSFWIHPIFGTFDKTLHCAVRVHVQHCFLGFLRFSGGRLQQSKGGVMEGNGLSNWCTACPLLQPFSAERPLECTHAKGYLVDQVLLSGAGRGGRESWSAQPEDAFFLQLINHSAAFHVVCNHVLCNRHCAVCSGIICSLGCSLTQYWGQPGISAYK